MTTEVKVVCGDCWRLDQFVCRPWCAYCKELELFWLKNWNTSDLSIGQSYYRFCTHSSLCVMAALVHGMPMAQNTVGLVGRCRTMADVEMIALHSTYTTTEYHSARHAQYIAQFNSLKRNHHPVLPTRELRLGSISIPLSKVANWLCTPSSTTSGLCA